MKSKIILQEKVNQERLNAVLKCSNIPINDITNEDDKKWLESLKLLYKITIQSCL